MAADQFCLRWNNFQLNIASALDNLKTDEDLVDVTLSCEGQNVKAHKVVLSACSPYFRGVFKENPCQHPIVILKDVSYDDVSALLSFMYQGEVYITQDRLASFLHTAELLQVRGLTGATNPFKDMTKVASNASPGLHQPSAVSYTSTPSYRSSVALEQSPSYQASSQATAFPAAGDFQRSSETDRPSSSPQPPASKRRKAFPRRVSVGGRLSTEETSESQDGERAKSRSSEDPGSCEVVSVSGTASVKQEPEDESIFEVDATMEEESNPISFGNTEEDVVRMESPGSDGTRRLDYYANVETAISEDPQQQNVKEEGAEGGAMMTPHSMLLRSLSGGGKQPMDASPSTTPTRPMEEGDDRLMSRPCPLCAKIISNKSNLQKHMKIVHSNQCSQQQCLLCERVFKNKYSLKAHMYTYHRQTVPK